MSFIIKGIDIPKTCRQCSCCADNGLVGVQRDYYCAALDCAPSVDDLDQKLTDCPLVEIPTPHGRLIDCESDFFPTAFRHNSTDYARGWNACLRSVLLSSTIIEAEE